MGKITKDEHKHLLGKTILGFKFEEKEEYHFHYEKRMDDYVGAYGKITYIYNSGNAVDIEFEDGKNWIYPMDIVLEKLEPKKTEEDLFFDIRKLLIKI